MKHMTGYVIGVVNNIVGCVSYAGITRETKLQWKETSGTEYTFFPKVF